MAVFPNSIRRFCTCHHNQVSSFVLQDNRAANLYRNEKYLQARAKRKYRDMSFLSPTLKQPEMKYSAALQALPALAPAFF